MTSAYDRNRGACEKSVVFHVRRLRMKSVTSLTLYAIEAEGVCHAIASEREISNHSNRRSLVMKLRSRLDIPDNIRIVIKLR